MTLISIDNNILNCLDEKKKKNVREIKDVVKDSFFQKRRK